MDGLKGAASNLGTMGANMLLSACLTEENTGDKAPCTGPVYDQYMVVLCPEYQHFPESEPAEFFQNTLNNVFAIFHLSKL
jgi:hypothetical protein